MVNLIPDNFTPWECMQRYADQMELYSINEKFPYINQLPKPGTLCLGKARKRKFEVMAPPEEMAMRDRYWILIERLKLHGPNYSGVYQCSLAYQKNAHVLLQDPLWIISAIEKAVGMVGAVPATEGVICPRYKFYAFGVVNKEYECHYTPQDRFISRQTDGHLPQLRIIQQNGITEFSQDPVYYKVKRVAKNQNQVLELNQMSWFKHSIDKTPEDCSKILRETASLIQRCIKVLSPLQPKIFETIYVHLTRDPAMLVASYFPPYSEASTLEDAERDLGIPAPLLSN